MYRVLKYSIYDLMRSRWTYIYSAFYFLFTLALLLLSDDMSKVVISLMNIILFLCPLIATMFGIMYYYNSREFTELLLALPLPRRHIFLGQYLGLAISLSVSMLLGIGIPFITYGIFGSPEIWNFSMLLVTGTFLSFIFAGIAYLIGLGYENKIKGFGFAILLWLFFAVIYDGIFLLAMSYFKEYPLDKFAIIASILNPIDLSRILILLKLDISALMGYTGAVFDKFLGSEIGMVVSMLTLVLWVVIPVLFILRMARSKDF
ncbi:MAG: ABC transporter permease [Saprospiraceae bacterium]|nr:ABC transporter permease [Saprospiraceae bacterium]